MNRGLAKFRRCVVWGTCCVLSAASGAQSYPNQPIKVLLPYAPGGVADITARVLAQKLSETLRQQVVIDNRPSAGGIVASEAVAKADPDGYTLIWLNQGHAVSASLFKSLPYDALKDFAPVSTVGYWALALVVNPDSRVKSVSELVSLAKTNPTTFNIGTINIGSTQHVAAELFKSMAGLRVETVPFKTSPSVITALKGNDVQAAFEILAPVMSQIKSGGLKALAVTSAQRFPGLPEVPTLAESGLPGYEATGFNGVGAPAKTPRPVIDRLNKEINVAVASPEVADRLLAMGVEARGSTPEALRELLIAETAKWRAVIEKASIPRQ
jgi:tripartite-type tricarboxylate transporter receptor subunit TctC